MPIQKTIFADHGIVYSKWSGHIQPEDIIDAQARHVLMPGYSPEHLCLIDLRCVESADLSISSVYSILDFISAQLSADNARDGKLQAVVLAPDDLTYGLTRPFQALSDGNRAISIHVFRDEDALTSEMGYAERNVDEMVEFFSTPTQPLSPSGPRPLN